MSSGGFDLTVTNPGAGSATFRNAVEVRPSAQPPVVITEVELDENRVEVRNVGTVPATLTNWEIRGSRPGSVVGTFTFPAFVLPAGRTVVVSETGGANTSTELFAPSVGWSWYNGYSGDLSLIDDEGRNVDYIRFSSSIVTTHQAPLGTGGAWMQPEFLSPAVGSIARAESSALYRSRTGLSRAVLTMPAGVVGRDNAVDPFEDNDAPRRALLNGPSVSFSNLAISERPLALPADEDWFGFVVEAGEAVVFEAQFTHASGNLDMQLFAPGEESTDLLSSMSATDNETLTLTSALSITHGGGVYRLRVFGAQNTYSLSATVLGERR